MYFNNYSQSQIVRVNGEQSARMFQMMPNSSALLLDESQPLVWLVQTDGAGYKTVTPYKIEKFTPEPQPDMTEIINRLTRLENQFNESYTFRNDQQNTAERRDYLRTDDEHESKISAIRGTEQRKNT